MPAIADSDDVYAWLIRGFVEAGLPDHTRGDREWLASGALSLEGFVAERGADGVVLEFLGQAQDRPAPDDEYTYRVVVERDADGARIVVRSEDTLFHHVFASWGGGSPPRNAPPRGDELERFAEQIVVEVRSHNARFTEWRAQGGVVTLGQRRGLPPANGAPADRALVATIDTLLRNHRSVAEGPANKWWVKAAPSAGPAKIEAGLGIEPQYITRKAGTQLTAEDVAHAARLRTAGAVLMASSALSALVFVGAVLASGWNMYQQGPRWVLAQGWPTAASVGASFVFVGVHLVAGYKLRSLRARGLVLGLTILGMLPCLAPCCLGGFPVGAWVLYLLRDERSKKVFNA